MPEAAFLGAATAVASLIPAVGTLLVWVPAGIYRILTHHVGMGILELVWGAVVVVGISDYVIRPRLVGRRGTCRRSSRSPRCSEGWSCSG
jgi:predicted PurR-regulated permease PerM